MGAISSLIVTACVAPALVAALTVMAQTGDMVRGGAALFAMSIGMGAPLLAVGAAQGKLLPQAGGWMVAVKNAFGFMMLGLAIWMMSRVLPGEVTLAAWAILIFMAGVYMGGLTTLTPAVIGGSFIVGVALLGLLDDMLGRGHEGDTPRGWRGHDVPLAEAVTSAEGAAEPLRLLGAEIPPGTSRRLSWSATSMPTRPAAVTATNRFRADSSRPGVRICP